VLSLSAPPHAYLAGAAIGAALFGGFFFAVFLIYPPGMGFGDVKLSLLLGSFLGYLEAPALVVVGLFMSFLCGAVLGAVPRLVVGGGRKAQVPFGPFLAMGTVLAIVAGRPLLEAYLGLTGA
ncbi:MAG: prepilin peptidase, partial [Actinomycetota bacterium]